jgi:chemotaxis protein MotB
MRQQLVSLTELLNLERKASTDLASDLARISNQLAATSAEKNDALAQLAAAASTLIARDSEIERLNKLQAETADNLAANLAAMEQQTADHQATLADAETRLAAVLERLAQAQLENSNTNRRANELEAENNASRAEILQMTNATNALRQRIETLTALLGQMEAQAARDKVAIASLGKSLNNALASRVQELQQFRSEFFGRLREVLSGRDEVQIVGDRFVFQSEVLFDQGQANIGTGGEEQLQKLAVTLADIATKIPSDINWVLQVDGHTDDIPIRAGRFADNWDLSTERALSVVRFLVDQGVPANRLAATGYGEFQPLDPENNDDARRRNRRIEMKITQRVAAQ